MIAVFLRSEFPALNQPVAESHLRGELLDALADDAYELQVAVLCAKFLFLRAERDQLLPLLVELGETGHRKMSHYDNAAHAVVDEAQALTYPPTGWRLGRSAKLA